MKVVDRSTLQLEARSTLIINPEKVSTQKGVSHSELRSYKCPFCPTPSFFNNFQVFDGHVRNLHAEKYESKSKQFFNYDKFQNITQKFPEFRRDPHKFKEHCAQCGFYFPSQEDLFAHFDICADFSLTATRKRRRTSGSHESGKRPKYNEEALANIAPQPQPQELILAVKLYFFLKLSKHFAKTQKLDLKIWPDQTTSTFESHYTSEPTNYHNNTKRKTSEVPSFASSWRYKHCYSHSSLNPKLGFKINFSLVFSLTKMVYKTLEKPKTTRF